MESITGVGKLWVSEMGSIAQAMLEEVESAEPSVVLAVAATAVVLIASIVYLLYTSVQSTKEKGRAKHVPEIKLTGGWKKVLSNQVARRGLDYSALEKLQHMNIDSFLPHSGLF
tara:strand:- start:1591 stop:1932 length:342 start_codon:yes stop_codon:yes gene_type:complete